jgi:hypothetical protein
MMPPSYRRAVLTYMNQTSSLVTINLFISLRGETKKEDQGSGMGNGVTPAPAWNNTTLNWNTNYTAETTPAWKRRKYRKQEANWQAWRVEHWMMQVTNRWRGQMSVTASPQSKQIIDLGSKRVKERMKSKWGVACHPSLNGEGIEASASAQSTTSREEDSVINADSILVICRVRYNVKGMQSLVLANASGKSPGQVPDVGDDKPAQRTDGLIRM